MAEENPGWVVVGIDGTARSAGALRYAVQQAQYQHCGLRLVHVGPRYEAMSWETPHLPWDMWPAPYASGQIDATGESFLQAALAEVKALAPELAVTTVLKSGSRIAELVDAADGGRSLVVGRETRTGVERFLFGATTASVAARTLVPTTVVPDDWERGSTPGKVVVGLRTSEHAAELFEAAFAEAAARGGGLEVVHAWELPDAYASRIEKRTHEGEWVKAGTRFIEDQLGSWRDRYPDIPIIVRVANDRPNYAILAAATEAALVVLVRRSVPRYLGAHLGTTARAVLRAAQCPVQIVPQRLQHGAAIR